MTPLSPHAEEALMTLTVEPMWRRRGFYVRASEADSFGAEKFPAAMIRLLMLRRYVSIRSRLNPRRVEATLSDEGKRLAAYLLAQAADLIDVEPDPMREAVDA